MSSSIGNCQRPREKLQRDNTVKGLAALGNKHGGHMVNETNLRLGHAMESVTAKIYARATEIDDRDVTEVQQFENCHVID